MFVFFFPGKNVGCIRDWSSLIGSAGGGEYDVWRPETLQGAKQNITEVTFQR